MDSLWYSVLIDIVINLLKGYLNVQHISYSDVDTSISSNMHAFLERLSFSVHFDKHLFKNAPDTRASNSIKYLYLKHESFCRLRFFDGMQTLNRTVT